MKFRYFYIYAGCLAFHDEESAKALRTWIMRNARDHVKPVAVVGIVPPVGTILRPRELRRLIRTARLRDMVI